MRFRPSTRTGKDAAMAVFFAVLSVLVFCFDIYPAPASGEGTKERALVLSVDNSNVFTVGLLRQGEQILEAKVLSGPRAGETFRAVNLLRAQMDLDKIFEPGDIALLAVPKSADSSTTVNAQDHYRTRSALVLFGLFALLLIAFGGMVGLKTLVSFVFAWAVIWKIVVPMCLRGADPILICLCAVCVLSAAIIFLVAGFTGKGWTAFAGTMLGVLSSCAMAWYFVGLFKINGAILPYSQALLYSGFENLNIADLYIGAIFLSSSGAVMDLSMDVAAGMSEIVRRNPDLPRGKLVESGLRIGRSVVGTMATTLLLAYSGGYLSLMMAFSAQGVSPSDFINNPYVASEFVKTIIGSFGLVLVAPFTALAGGFILKAPGAFSRAN